ncbi:hypothetical protein BJY01DRAFT_256121 [Aspergillus pseudoustus]|uniref:Carrier domain-containing protein n=1 Tax=Aspergillus pseudoustus TaxID=1810923 RepID=A0ABR4IFH5_9EURO
MVSQDSKLLQHARRFSLSLVQETELMEGLALAIRQSPVIIGEPDSPCSSLLGLGNSKPASDPRVRKTWDRDARFGIYYGLEATGEVKPFPSGGRMRDVVDRIEADPVVLDDPEIQAELTREFDRHFTEHMPSAADMDEKQIANLAIDSLMAIEVKGTVRRNLGLDISLVEISRAGTVRGLSTLTISHSKAKFQGSNKPKSETNNGKEDDEEEGNSTVAETS